MSDGENNKDFVCRFVPDAEGESDTTRAAGNMV